jgi:hypothetical protein
LMSQLFALTVKTNGFAEPASTVMMSPLCEAPKACGRMVSGQQLQKNLQGT